MLNKEFVSFEELYVAYLDCRKQKRSSYNCIKFEMNEMKELYALYEELNSMTYQISPSSTFIYHEEGTNHYREIFAADFRDRIVQHLLINRTVIIFEDEFIDHSFSCRKNKGTSYAVQCLQKDIQTYTDNYIKECIVVNLDIKSFFASLDKNILFDLLCKLLYDNAKKLNIAGKLHINKYDIVYTKWLIRKIIFNDPREGCIFKQPKSYWNNIAADKSAFHIPSNKYLPVGNITSQYFANIYLSNLDKRMAARGPYGRYVDDTYHLCKDKEEAQLVIKMMNEECEKLNLKIHPNKIYMQDYRKGVRFVGKIVKKNRIYVRNKTIGKFWKYLNYFYDTFKEVGQITVKELSETINCINSRLGLMMHANTFNIRRRILSSQFMTALGKYVYIENKMKKIIAYEEYRIGDHFRKKHLRYNEDKGKRKKLKTINKTLR